MRKKLTKQDKMLRSKVASSVAKAGKAMKSKESAVTNLMFIAKHLDFINRRINEDQAVKASIEKEEITVRDDVTYGAVEAMLFKRGFSVKKLVRDRRGDWGDDGGYIVSISERKGVWYVHLIEINYNFTLESIVFDQADFNNYVRKYGANSCTPDFVTFSSFKEAVYAVKLLANALRYNTKVNAIFNNIDARFMKFPFNEFMVHDYARLMYIEETTYTPCFLNWGKVIGDYFHPEDTLFTVK